ncbi:DUF2953 domain-containing protein [Syntrophomonas erecta]
MQFFYIFFAIIIILFFILWWWQAKWEFRSEFKSQGDSGQLVIIIEVYFTKLIKREYRYVYNQLPLNFNGLLTMSEIDATSSQSDIVNTSYSRDHPGAMELLANFRRAYRRTKRVLRHLVIETLEWRTNVGMANAMETALVSGSLWAVKGTAISWLSSYSPIEKIKLLVEPDFSNRRLSSQINCIARMRMVHIILVGPYILAKAIRGYLNGITTGKWKSSHRRSYEDGHAKHKGNGGC